MGNRHIRLWEGLKKFPTLCPFDFLYGHLMFQETLNLVEPARKLSLKIPDESINRWAVLLLKNVNSRQGNSTTVRDFKTAIFGLKKYFNNTKNNRSRIQDYEEKIKEIEKKKSAMIASITSNPFHKRVLNVSFQ